MTDFSRRISRIAMRMLKYAADDEADEAEDAAAEEAEDGDDAEEAVQSGPPDYDITAQNFEDFARKDFLPEFCKLFYVDVIGGDGVVDMITYTPDRQFLATLNIDSIQLDDMKNDPDARDYSEHVDERSLVLPVMRNVLEAVWKSMANGARKNDYGKLFYTPVCGAGDETNLEKAKKEFWQEYVCPCVNAVTVTTSDNRTSTALNWNSDIGLYRGI